MVSVGTWGAPGLALPVAWPVLTDASELRLAASSCHQNLVGEFDDALLHHCWVCYIHEFRDYRTTSDLLGIVPVFSWDRGSVFKPCNLLGYGDTPPLLCTRVGLRLIIHFYSALR